MSFRSSSAALALIILLECSLALAQPTPPSGKKPDSGISTPPAGTKTESGASSGTSGSTSGSTSTPSAAEEAFTLENSLYIRDPFRRPLPKAALGQEGGNIPPLERYEIDKYKLVGIITGPRKNKAMVTDPDGQMHVISETMYIGARHGKITKIAPGQITIEEKVVNLLGQEEKVETFLEFPKEKDGKPQ